MASTGVKIFRGWYVLVGLFFATFLGAWGRFILAVFMGVFKEEFNWSAAQINLSISIALWVYALSVIFVGRLIDTWGGRRVIMTGGILLTAGFAALYFVTRLWQLYLIHGIILAVATSMTHMVPTQAVGRKWFIKYAGLAGGILSAGFAISQAILSPVLTYSTSINGWRITTLGASFFGVMVFILAYLLVIDKPEKVGLKPCGADGLKLSRQSGPQEPEMTLSQSLRKASFWFIFIGYGILAIPVQGTLSNIINWGNSVGISMAGAGLAATALNLTAVLGKVIWGGLGDRLGKRFVLVLGQAFCSLIMLLGWLLVDNPFSLYIFSISFGFMYGAGFAVIVPYLGDLFGRNSIGSLFGIVTASHGLLGGFGPLLFGVTFDATGGYNLAALACVGLCALSCLCFFLAKPVKGITKTPGEITSPNKNLA